MRFWIWIGILVALLGLAVWGCCGLNQHLIVAIDKYGDAAVEAKSQTAGIAPIEDRLTKLFVEIERPCKGAGDDPNSCGLIANVKKVAIDTRHAVITTQLQVQQTQPLLANAAGAIQTEAEKLGKTTDAATALLNTANSAVDQLNDDRSGLSPLMQAYLRSGTDLDDLLKRRAVTETLDNVAGITGNVNRMTLDGQRVTTKLADDFLAPQPWWKKAGRFAGDAFDYGALAARHVP